MFANPSVSRAILTSMLLLAMSAARAADKDPDDAALTCAEGPSDTRSTVFIENCDSGVKNRSTGKCTIADLMRACQPKPADQRVRCYAKTSNALKDQGVLSGAEKGALQICSADDRETEGEKPNPNE